MEISTRQLGYFVALAEEGSFGGAADRVHVTQPALSQQIRALEDRLGTPLVERLPRGARLTRAGQHVYERARRILGELRELDSQARLHSGLSGRLLLGVIPTVAPYLLPVALTRIREMDLSLELRVQESQTATLLSALAEGRLDAIVVALPVGEPGLAVTPLFSDRFLLAGSREGLDARFAGGRRPGAGDVPPEQLLLLEEGHCLADQALEFCGLNSRQKTDLGASSLGTLCRLVAAGFGLTLVPEIAVRAEQAAAPGLALRRFRTPEPTRKLALVRRASQHDDGWAAALADILQAAGQELVDAARPIGA